MDVEVHPVLRRLVLGHLEEEHARPNTVGVDDREGAVRVGPVDAERVQRVLPRVEAGGRWLLDVAEHLTPELRQLPRSGGVDGDLDRSCHGDIVAERGPEGNVRHL
jgi:hypothetical protein